METDDNTRRLEEIANAFRARAFIQRDLTAIDEVLTADFVDHFAPPWDPPGREGVRRRFGQAAVGFHTERVEVVLSISRGNVLMQAIRIHLKHTGDFMGMAATQREFSIGGFDAFEVRGDKLAAHWGIYDVSRIPDLLGMAPGPQAQGAPSWMAMWEATAGARS